MSLPRPGCARDCVAGISPSGRPTPPFGKHGGWAIALVTSIAYFRCLRRGDSCKRFSLTPAFRPVRQPRNIDISRFNGLHRAMSLHSYSRCWIHLIWGTLNREKILNRTVAKRLSRYLGDYAKTKSIYMKINHVNADHVHALVDLPTGVSIEDLVQLLKGSSSHWVNENNLVRGKFAWGRGYGVFSVSQSNVDQVVAYISGQHEHHRVRSFAEEFREFAERHRLRSANLESR